MAAPSTRRWQTGFPFVASGLVFFAALAVLTPLVFGQPSRFDEGFVVSGAMMIRRGWIAIRDFYVIYGAGEYLLVAAVHQLFGEDLAVSRWLHAAVMAATGGAVVALASVSSNGRQGWACFSGVAYIAMAAHALPSASYAAMPAVLLLLCAALGLDQWHARGLRTGLFAASILTGFAGLFRWDFGLFGTFALIAAITVSHAVGGLDSRHRVGDLAIATGIPALIMVAGFGPLLYIGDAQRWFSEVPWFLMHEFDHWRGISFVEPQLLALADAFRKGDHWTIAQASTNLVFAATPFLLIAVTVIGIALRLRRIGGRLGRADATALLLALLCIGLLNQMRVRPALGQGLPAFALALTLIPYAINLAQCPARRSRRVLTQGLVVAAAGLWLLLPAYAAKDRLQAALTGMRPAIDLPRASGSHATHHAASRREWAAYAEMVDYIRSQTPDGGAIFSGVADTSRLFVNDALLYFVADRPSATRWIEMEPGLTNTQRGQLEVIAALETSQTRVVVLWQLVSEEPNATSRSNGIHLLDAYIREHYGDERRFGDYRVLLRKRG